MTIGIVIAVIAGVVGLFLLYLLGHFVWTVVVDIKEDVETERGIAQAKRFARQLHDPELTAGELQNIAHLSRGNMDLTQEGIAQHANTYQELNVWVEDVVRLNKTRSGSVEVVGKSRPPAPPTRTEP